MVFPAGLLLVVSITMVSSAAVNDAFPSAIKQAAFDDIIGKYFAFDPFIKDDDDNGPVASGSRIGRERVTDPEKYSPVNGSSPPEQYDHDEKDLSASDYSPPQSESQEAQVEYDSPPPVFNSKYYEANKLPVRPTQSPKNKQKNKPERSHFSSQVYEQFKDLQSQVDDEGYRRYPTATEPTKKSRPSGKPSPHDFAKYVIGLEDEDDDYYSRPKSRQSTIFESGYYGQATGSTGSRRPFDSIVPPAIPSDRPATIRASRLFDHQLRSFARPSSSRYYYEYDDNLDMPSSILNSYLRYN